MRYVRPGIAVFCVALIASLCVHLPVYEVLGVLAVQMRRAPSAIAHAVVEFELAALGDEPPEAREVALSPAPDLPMPQLALPEPPKPVPERDREREAPRPDPRPEEVVRAPDEVKPIPTEMLSKHAITQKSDDPDVEPPPDARFVADESRRVEEEMVARVRNEHEDAIPDPGSGKSQVEPETEDEVGNDDQTEVADLQNVEGEDERTPDVDEAKERPVAASEPSAGRRDAKAVTASATPPTPVPSEQVEPKRATGTPLIGGEPRPIVIDDGNGRFTIRQAPVGAGPDAAGGAVTRGALSRERESRAGSRAREGVNLQLSWSQFEDTFGAEDLQHERQAYLSQRRSSARGRSRAENWKKFRAAIENHVPYVRSGNQTALNAAASPFANYLAVVHRRIHREFAFEFLRNLPIAGGPFGDLDLHTMLEIVINGDGSLHHVGVAKSSGFTPFDYGAFNAVTDAAPFARPPRAILSGDGRVYVHWGFYRNERACGTFNATPYILPAPPGTPKPGHGPLRDAEPGAPGHDHEHDHGVPGDAEFGRLDPSRHAPFGVALAAR
jgi:TonB family protein